MESRGSIRVFALRSSVFFDRAQFTEIFYLTRLKSRRKRAHNVPRAARGVDGCGVADLVRRASRDAGGDGSIAAGTRRRLCVQR